jgi:protein-S-isoprenylcysteine O-methyltransferase Ste14
MSNHPEAPVQTGGPADVVFRHRGTLAALIVAPIIASTTTAAQPSWGEAAAAFAVLALGLALRTWACRSLGRRAHVSRPGARELRDTGAYSHVRNPIYIANTTFAVSCAIAAGLGVRSIAVAVYLAAVYQLVVLAEERALSAAFGEAYASYIASVPRWIPRLSGRPPAALAPWREVLVWEGPAAAGLIAAILTLLALRNDLLDPILDLRPLGISTSSWTLSIAFAVAGIVGLSTEKKYRRHEQRRLAKLADPGEGSIVNPA